MKNNCLKLLLIGVIILVYAVPGLAFSQGQIKAYQTEITTGGEYGDRYDVSRWNWECNIFIEDRASMPDEIWWEINRVGIELSEMGVPLFLVDKKEDANFIIYYRSGAAYEAVEPGIAKGLTKDNWGVFHTICDGRGNIVKGTMYVDPTRVTSMLALKHLIREELTQAMGFCQDSWKYPDSIFYQGWSTTTAYSALDKAIIRNFYAGL